VPAEQSKRDLSSGKLRPLSDDTQKQKLFGLAEGAEVDAELLAFFVEVAAFEAEGFGGVGHVVVILFQDGEERFALESFDPLRKDSAGEGAVEWRGIARAGGNRSLGQRALDGGRLNFVFGFEE
jgi:hypothetical protein